MVYRILLYRIYPTGATATLRRDGDDSPRPPLDPESDENRSEPPSEFPLVHTVTSSDGTTIGYEHEGTGPPVVLLHGGSGTRETWDTFRPYLADDCTLVVPDRRGRGAIGDADGYTLAREVADLSALLDAIDGEPTVFGHSFGGLVALAAAEAGVDVGRLALYEPAVLVGDYRGDDLADRMQARLDAGDREGAMALFFRDGGGVSDPTSLPFWPEGVNVHLSERVVRENRAVEAHEPPGVGDVEVPTLLLAGEHGPEHLRDAVFALAERLGDSRVVELPGVGHTAIESAPERVAAAVRSFVEETEPKK